MSGRHYRQGREIRVHEPKGDVADGRPAAGCELETIVGSHQGPTADTDGVVWPAVVGRSLRPCSSGDGSAVDDFVWNHVLPHGVTYRRHALMCNRECECTAPREARCA